MSTIKVTNLRHESASSSNITLDSSNNAVVAGTLGCTGNLTVTSGNVVLSSGNGIDFSAAGNAGGMTSELLDDYEVGAWTPTLSNFTGTYTTQSGIYTKIGNIVTLNVHIDVATNTGTDLQYWISGMPFSKNSTPASVVGSVYIYQAATSTGHMISSINSQQRWYVHPNNGLTSATSTNGHTTTQLGTGQIFATITYRVA